MPRLSNTDLCLLLGLLFVPLAAAQSAEWEKLTERSQQLYEKRQYAEGQRVAIQALSLAERTSGPESSDVAASLHNLAEFSQALRKYVEAERLYRRSLTIVEKLYGAEDPAVAAVLNSLAGCHKAQGRTAEAEKLYQRALAADEKALGSNDPAVARDLNNLASLYQAQGKYSQAETFYKKSVDTLGPADPNRITGLLNLAGLYRLQKRLDEAEPVAEQAYAASKELLGDQHPLVEAALRTLDAIRKEPRKEAVDPGGLEAAALRKPNDPEIQFQLGVLYDKQARYPEARKAFQAVVRAQPQRLEAYEYLALLYEFEQNYEQGIATYKIAVELERKQTSRSEWPYLNYGILLSKLHRDEESLSFLEQAIGRNPNSAKAHYEIGRVFLRLGRLEPAKVALLRSIQLDKGLAKAYYFLGHVYRQMNRTEQAEREWTRFKELERAASR